MKASLHKTRCVYLTMDTDWCSEEMLEFALALFTERELPCTIFATGRYAALQGKDDRLLEVGLHPNFNDVVVEQHRQKLQMLLQIYPRAVGVSSHALASSTPLLDLFKQMGLRYERNILRYKDATAQPFVYYNGLLRLPIFWEDDIWFSFEPGTKFNADAIPPDASGLIFNFHPVHLFMNTASAAQYESFKPYQQEPQRLARYRHTGYGALSFFEDLAVHIRDQRLTTGLLRDFLQP